MGAATASISASRARLVASSANEACTPALGQLGDAGLVQAERPGDHRVLGVQRGAEHRRVLGVIVTGMPAAGSGCRTRRSSPPTCGWSSCAQPARHLAGHRRGVHRTRRVVFCAAELHDAAGTLMATSRCTQVVLPATGAAGRYGPNEGGGPPRDARG
jgi:hypothetical protein